MLNATVLLLTILRVLLLSLLHRWWLLHRLRLLPLLLVLTWSLILILRTIMLFDLVLLHGRRLIRVLVVHLLLDSRRLFLVH